MTHLRSSASSGTPGSDPQGHSPSPVTGKWHSLADHLRGTALLAEEFGRPFGANGLARLVAAVHDTGKAGCSWQNGLATAAATGSRVGVGHRHAGAELTGQVLGTLPFAAMIPLGHHGGLRDWDAVKQTLRRVRTTWQADEARQVVGPASSAQDADEDRGTDPDLAASIRWVRKAVPDLLDPPDMPDWVLGAAHQVASAWRANKYVPPAGSGGFLDDPHRLELWLRMVFSALVDADYLDTEAHFAGGPVRRGATTGMTALLARFEVARSKTFKGRPDSRVRRVRERLYDQAVARAGEPPGLFTLKAPTGAGKTLTAMGFALTHAQSHGLRRVIVAAPFVTVTEQNAAVYRSLLDPAGLGDVLEHHSGVDAAGTSPANRALTANWDAPVVVTTTVQLLESLHGCSPRACRKLHRVAGSVIVLDEVQALPSHLLPTILTTLRLLVQDYSCSVVLTTATLPAFDVFTGSAFAGLPQVDLIDDPDETARELARVTFDWRRYPASGVAAPRGAPGLAAPGAPGRSRPDPDWSTVTSDLIKGARDAGGSGLLIASTTADAGAVFRLVRERLPPKQAARHLSTRMTREHRTRTLADVRTRLLDGSPVVLTSTQVIEAGVDVDFPFLIRVCAPAEAIIQAAGRCNREGRRTQADSVVVVAAVEGAGTPGMAYATAADLAQEWFAPWTSRPDGPEPLDRPKAMTDYFIDLYRSQRPGSAGKVAGELARSRPLLQYETTAVNFRMIDQVGVNVLVPPDASDRPGTDTRLFDSLVEALDSGRRLTPPQVRVLVEQTATVSQSMSTSINTRKLTDDLALWKGPYDTDLGCTSDTPATDILW